MVFGGDASRFISLIQRLNLLGVLPSADFDNEYREVMRTFRLRELPDSVLNVLVANGTDALMIARVDLAVIVDVMWKLSSLFDHLQRVSMCSKLGELRCSPRQ